MENKGTIKSITRGKSCIFEKINKIDKPLGRVIKRESRHKQKLLGMKKIASQQVMWRLKENLRI